jgi:CRISPR-associated protein Csc1
LVGAPSAAWEAKNPCGGDYGAACPLNPLDLAAGVLRAFDIVSMPPPSLVANARCGGGYYQIDSGVGIPVGMAYTFP